MVLHRLIRPLCLGGLLALTSLTSASSLHAGIAKPESGQTGAAPLTQPSPHKRVSTPEDRAALEQVLFDFMASIRQKDGRKLSTLVLNSNIPFTSPGDQARVDSVRQYDVNFDGVGTGGFLSFARYVSTTTEQIEEKFYNVQITQDGPVAWALFDYEFYADGKMTNFGTEGWQLRKTDGKWKIFSVIWVTHDPEAGAGK